MTISAQIERLTSDNQRLTAQLQAAEWKTAALEERVVAERRVAEERLAAVTAAETRLEERAAAEKTRLEERVAAEKRIANVQIEQLQKEIHRLETEASTRAGGEGHSKRLKTSAGGPHEESISDQQSSIAASWITYHVAMQILDKEGIWLRPFKIPQEMMKMEMPNPNLFTWANSERGHRADYLAHIQAWLNFEDEAEMVAVDADKMTQKSNGLSATNDVIITRQAWAGCPLQYAIPGIELKTDKDFDLQCLPQAQLEFLVFGATSYLAYAQLITDLNRGGVMYTYVVDETGQRWLYQTVYMSMEEVINAVRDLCLNVPEDTRSLRREDLVMLEAPTRDKFYLNHEHRLDMYDTGDIRIDGDCDVANLADLEAFDEVLGSDFVLERIPGESSESL